MDNRIFNVNGDGQQLLEQALTLACAQEYWKTPSTIKAWEMHPDHGLILCKWPRNDQANKLIAPLSGAEITPMVWAWLQTEEAKKIPCTGWDAEYTGDGDTRLGWRVYVGDWGHVGSFHGGVVCAVKPAWMWYGK